MNDTYWMMLNEMSSKSKGSKNVTLIHSLFFLNSKKYWIFTCIYRWVHRQDNLNRRLLAAVKHIKFCALQLQFIFKLQKWLIKAAGRIDEALSLPRHLSTPRGFRLAQLWLSSKNKNNIKHLRNNGSFCPCERWDPDDIWWPWLLSGSAPVKKLWLGLCLELGLELEFPCVLCLVPQMDQMHKVRSEKKMCLPSWTPVHFKNLCCYISLRQETGMDCRLISFRDTFSLLLWTSIREVTWFKLSPRTLVCLWCYMTCF